MSQLMRALAPVAAPLNRALGRTANAVWMVGDGRSGSSWAANIVSRTCGYRQLFEPFHPIEVRKFGGYQLNHYQRPGSRNEPLRRKLQDVFEGRISNRRVNQAADRILYNGLLAKDVFATLLAAWGIENFPHVRLVLQVRNPFAVAVSKARNPNHRWTRGPAELLLQPDVVDAHLSEHADFLRHIEAREDPILNHVAVWSILHSTLFRDFDARRLHIMIYSRTLEDPAREMSRLLAHIGESGVAPDLDSAVMSQPARYSEGSSVNAVRATGDRAWLEEVTAEQIRGGNEILSRFGLGELFNNGQPAPNFEEIAASLWPPTGSIRNH